MTGTARILLVEDDPQDVELTLRALRSENVRSPIEVVRDGEEALDYLFCRGLYAARSPDQPPTLVLVDLKLPKISGLQVIDAMKSNAAFKSIPVIVLSSSGEPRDIAESYRLGVNSYVQKPVDIMEFRKSIRALAQYWLEVNRSPFAQKPLKLQ